jgi:SHS family lactate transporter-like MFS transporter
LAQEVSLPGRRAVTPDQWRAFLAAYLGWLLDGFDFTILTFLLVDIQRSFDVNNALAGALGTVTLFFRVVGGISAGTAADRWGRKGPLIFSILWYSLFACFSGFSTSYRTLFALRALFGVGMGGVWAAGMPLAIEHWPAHLRGVVSGLLQGGYSAGFVLPALAFATIYPIANQQGAGWRVMLWIGIAPAALAVWIAVSVKESPIWLERQRQLRHRRARDTLSLARLFEPDLRRVTLQTSAMMSAFLAFYHSITFWYPTLLVETGRSTLPYLVVLNAGTLVGNFVWGRTAETRLGRRGAATVATVVGVLAAPLFLFSGRAELLLAGAAIMGLSGTANFGVIPTYLSEQFPTSVRAAGAGFSYHVGAAVGSVAPFVVGALHDGGMALPSAMAASVVASGVLVVTSVWLGPETRGRPLT